MLKIGIAQINNHFDLSENLRSILRAIDVQSQNKADLVLFPECAITGYNTGILKVDREAIVDAVQKVKKLAKERKINVALPTPWPNDSGNFHNSILFISEHGEIAAIFNKIGLQRGEERLFVSSNSHKRVFEIKEHKIGIIICIETSHHPWAYLKETDQADLIFWPGFYAVTEEDANLDWSTSKSDSDKKVRDNLMSHWRAPLLHVNCSSSPESHFWPGKLFGGSAVYDSDGTTLFSAKRSMEDFSMVNIEDKKISSVVSLSP